MALFSSYCNFDSIELRIAEKKGILYNDTDIYINTTIGDDIKCIMVCKKTDGTYPIFCSKENPKKTAYGNYRLSLYNYICPIEDSNLEGVLFKLFFDKDFRSMMIERTKESMRYELLQREQLIKYKDWADFMLPLTDDDITYSYIEHGYMTYINNDYNARLSIKETNLIGYITRLNSILDENDLNFTHLKSMVGLYGYNLKIHNKGNKSSLICYKSINIV